MDYVHALQQTFIFLILSSLNASPIDSIHRMRILRKKLFVGLNLLGLLFCLRFLFLFIGPQSISNGHLEYKRACIMYDIDPFDPSVKHLLKNKGLQKCRKTLIHASGEVNCAFSGTHRADKYYISWSFGNSQLLAYDRNHESYANATCCARTISRIEQSPSNYDENADWLIK